MEEALEKISQLHFTTGYTNKVIFAGRNFGVNQSGATFGSSYHHRSGFNVEYTGNYWGGMQNPYALTEVGTYVERPVKENFYLSAGYWRLFFHNGDGEERSTFTNVFMVDESWFTKFGLLNASYYYFKGSETAHRVDVSFSKAFDFYHLFWSDKFSVEPTLTVTFATVNYFAFLSGLVDLENPNAFAAGNYEFALPISYRKMGKYELNAAWHYAMPVAVDTQEHVHNVAYYTIEMIITHLFSKSTK